MSIERRRDGKYNETLCFDPRLRRRRQARFSDIGVIVVAVGRRDVRTRRGREGLLIVLISRVNILAQAIVVVIEAGAGVSVNVTEQVEGMMVQPAVD